MVSCRFVQQTKVIKLIEFNLHSTNNSICNNIVDISWLDNRPVMKQNVGESLTSLCLARCRFVTTLQGGCGNQKNRKSAIIKKNNTKATRNGSNAYHEINLLSLRGWNSIFFIFPSVITPKKTKCTIRSMLERSKKIFKREETKNLPCH